MALYLKGALFTAKADLRNGKVSRFVLQLHRQEERCGPIRSGLFEMQVKIIQT